MERNKIVPISKASNFRVYPSAVSAAQRANERKQLLRIRHGSALVLGLTGAVAIYGGLAVVANKTADFVESHIKIDTSSHLPKEPSEIVVSNTDLDSLNLVFVNDGMNEAGYESLISDLKEEGISCESVYSSECLDSLNGTETVVGFLDYNSAEGNEIKVVGQYEDRDNKADPLAIAMATGFHEETITREDIQLGVHVQDENGYTKLGPSVLEMYAGPMNVPFVSLAIPKNYDQDRLKENFIEGLARYDDYIKKGKETNLLARMTYADGSLSQFAVNHDLDYDTLMWANDLGENVEAQNHVKMDETFFLSNELNKSFKKSTEVITEKNNHVSKMH